MTPVGESILRLLNGEPVTMAERIRLRKFAAIMIKVEQEREK